MPTGKRSFAAPLLLVVFSLALVAQSQTYTLSGKVMDPEGHPVPSAKVSAKSMATGHLSESVANAEGIYSIADLPGGDYQVWAVAGELSAQPIKVTLAAAQTTDLTLAPRPARASDVPNAPQQQQNAPGTPSPGTPSMSDLGFSPNQMQADAQLQATLAKRTRMLKTHQRLGLITTIPMAAALFTGPLAKAKGRDGQLVREPSDANLDFHAALGGLTTALYFTTAYYAVFAPRIPNNPKHGGIRWHEALAFVHGPGMILTPVLGYMAYRQENSGEKVHGFAAQHGTVATVTALAYGTSIVAVSWPIHIKFWEKK